MSLASVLVISAKMRRLSLNVLASACDAALRLPRVGSCIRLSVGSIASDLPSDLEAQAGDGLVEQPVPGRVGGHRLLVEQLLDAILELIGLVLADVLEPRPVVAERGIGHRGFELGVVDAVELEREEQQMRGGRRDALLHVAVELRARGIDGVAGMDEPGIGDRAGRADRRASRSASPRSASALPGVGPRPRARRACPCRPPRRRRCPRRRDRDRASPPDRRSRR